MLLTKTSLDLGNESVIEFCTVTKIQMIMNHIWYLHCISFIWFHDNYFFIYMSLLFVIHFAFFISIVNYHNIMYNIFWNEARQILYMFNSFNSFTIVACKSHHLWILNRDKVVFSWIKVSNIYHKYAQLMLVHLFLCKSFFYSNVSRHLQWYNNWNRNSFSNAHITMRYNMVSNFINNT